MMSPRPRAFTLVEMLVSMAIVVMLLGILLSIVDATRQTWSYTRAKVSEFQDAREAFESITRGLSQATLNTYWDYNSPTNPTAYHRQSELRFISGDSATLLQGVNWGSNPALTGTTVTHAVFFQAPFGFVNNPVYQNLKTLLNTCGYFIQFGSDQNFRPGFINALNLLKKGPALRYRFRVMEFMEPSDSLTIYGHTNGHSVYTQSQSGVPQYAATDWLTKPLNNWFGEAAPALTGTGPTLRVLGENIVALVLLPKLTPGDIANLNGMSASSGTYSDASLVSSEQGYPYYYDSTGGGSTGDDMGGNTSNPYLDSTNQLPPVVQVTLVAVDEPSYSRFQAAQTAMPSALGLTGLFKTVGSTSDPSKPGYAQDLQTLQNTLQKLQINYRVYTANVSIQAAKWSREQTN
jgi:uncharacterized protein (TIGR02599 family)